MADLAKSIRVYTSLHPDGEVIGTVDRASGRGKESRNQERLKSRGIVAKILH
jgi:hypothetical protein